MSETETSPNNVKVAFSGDRSGVEDMKSRAKQMLDKGAISDAEYSKLVAKANKVLGHGK